MSKPSYVVSLSGGKDSTAMLLMMLDRGEPVADIVFFDTGWDFPQMYEHLLDLEKYIGRKITRLGPKQSFDYMFAKLPVTSRKTGEVHYYGRGWPAPLRRWCTGRKQEALNCHLNALTYRYGLTLPIIQCIGFAADESRRIPFDGKRGKGGKHVESRYPLVEWGVTEADALSFCYERGFIWNGLYEVFDRLSCFCCPLGGIGNSRKLRKHFPDLWERMLEMESWLPEGDKGRRFIDEKTVSDLDARFAAEDAENARMICLPMDAPKTMEVSI